MRMEQSARAGGDDADDLVEEADRLETDVQAKTPNSSRVSTSSTWCTPASVSIRDRGVSPDRAWLGIENHATASWSSSNTALAWSNTWLALSNRSDCTGDSSPSALPARARLH